MRIWILCLLMIALVGIAGCVDINDCFAGGERNCQITSDGRITLHTAPNEGVSRE
jgi:hypothetical protein